MLRWLIGLPKIAQPRNISMKGMTKTMAMLSAMGMYWTEATKQ